MRRCLSVLFVLAFTSNVFGSNVIIELLGFPGTEKIVKELATEADTEDLSFSKEYKHSSQVKKNLPVHHWTAEPSNRKLDIFYSCQCTISHSDICPDLYFGRLYITYRSLLI